MPITQPDQRNPPDRFDNTYDARDPSNVVLVPGLRPLHRVPPSIIELSASSLVKLLGQFHQRSGLSINEIARRLDCSPQNVRQYMKGRRVPTLDWLLKFAHAAGGKLYVEYPDAPK